MLTQLSSHHYHTLKVWYLVQHSLVSFKKIIDYFGNCEKATQPDGLAKWSSLGLHANHLKRVSEFQTPQGQTQFEQLVQQVVQHTDFILTADDSGYPSQLLPYTDYPPIIFGKGQAQALLQPQIAIVGSRKPSPHGRQVAYDFAYYLSEKGFFISSGLAYGIDEAAHQGASTHQRTIAVTGTGLDTTYPAQNKKLAEHILAQNGAIITEFLPGTPPLQQHFPRRNRIVSGLSLGVLVVEATLKSGSLITANKAAEQGKTVFAIPGHIYSEFHQGCHQLIREGAILIDHPEQIIEDLALPTQWQSQQQNQTEEANTNTPEIPEHLIDLYQSLDWVGQNIDQLVVHHNIPVSELTSSLMELELLGLCMQQSGLYLRCRS
ncbi:DNA-processing protein DprA [Acinetobacter baumannii]|uniref:DNA-processing protein DprA n=1 Tax=Acinetobacter baumannii TaxID=470 RepID=UPI0008DE1259|nr:DNA-processing protein DprA [Acinetobacter baumannii]MDC4684125.1 DNA-processing protein DprA [Acinetobacter baumannii]MDH1312070.1 DNA-processing protein DprA [Acinetobacter baumannii]MDH2496474.1 DNA-processing protein DprA [Acinetobacter baumannii]MDH2517320.1 DNA-processing protein DprA [Acinetobacter baumannii]OIF73285.1 DNA protecting protein DprA [Acinetobacter baumannii]